MSNQQWWHDDMSSLAEQLGKGALTEMYRRILTSNIQREKLKPDESTDRMRSFFDREIQRFQKRKQAAADKKLAAESHQTKMIDAYKAVIRKLIKGNESFAKKCKDYSLKVEKVHCFGSVYSWQ
jgi:hypothetical protein